MTPTLSLAQVPSPNAHPAREKEKRPFLAEPGDASSNPKSPGRVGENRSILVVDDNRVVLRAFELKLKASGFKVTAVKSAATAARAAEQAESELILLDLNFPSEGGMQWTGFTVMQWLRRFPRMARIPIIIMSGSDAVKYKEQALAEGAVGFLQKPLDYQELLAAILQALPRPQAKESGVKV